MSYLASKHMGTMRLRGLLILAAIILIAFLWWRAAPARIEGVITLRRLQCEQEPAGNVQIWIVGVNNTSVHLRNLRVVLSAGKGENVVTAERTMALVQRGGVIDLRATLMYPGSVDVCFPTFYLGGQQITARYRP